MDTSKYCMGCMAELSDEQVCPQCGFDNATEENGCGLPLRTVIAGKYIVGKVIDMGGEGITYIGKETETGKTVRIREFFPQGICERETDGTITIDKDNSFSFNESLICFIDLAKSLSKFNGNDNLLDIIDIFEAGNTAYYITENVSGITLREFLLRNGGQLTWEQVRSLIVPIMSTISALHEENIVHRGISPETLLVGRDGKVRIVGFCIAAARSARSDISSRLFPGFAAIEQYGFDAKPGPWTDVYGLAATIFRTLVGNPPPEATDRVASDNMTIPAKLVEEIPKSVLASLAGALQIMPENRTKTMEDFRLGLTTDSAKPVAVPEEEKKPVTFFKQYGVLMISGAAALVIIILAIIIGLNWNKLFGSEGVIGGNIFVPTSSELVYNSENETAQIVDFKGMTCAEVTEYYEELGFKNVLTEVVSKEYNDKYARGQIYKQVQKVGEDLKAEEPIQVYVSLGPELVELPDFVEDEVDYMEAKVKLLEMGFLPENIVERAVTKLGEDTNKIFEMSPEGGTKVSIESRVELVYYKEIENIEVKNFVGLNYHDDIKNKSDYSAYQFDIEEIYSEIYEEGLVIKQSVPKGTKIKNTETITLTVSRGEPPTLPNFTNALKSDAINVLTRNEIQYTIIEQYNDTIASGRVIKTNPSAGSTVNGTVTIYVSKGAKPVSSVASSTVPSTETKPIESSEETTTSSEETTSSSEITTTSSEITTSSSEESSVTE